MKIKFNPYCIVAMKKRDKDISKEVDCDTTNISTLHSASVFGKTMIKYLTLRKEVYIKFLN